MKHPNRNPNPKLTVGKVNLIRDQVWWATHETMQPVKEPPTKPPTLTVGKVNLIRYWARRATLEAIANQTPFTRIINQVRSH